MHHGPPEPGSIENGHLRTFINQHQAEIVSRRVLLVDVSECGREVESAEEQTDGNGFTSRRRSIHDLKRRQ
jgi:hypothetical protein